MLAYSLVVCVQGMAAIPAKPEPLHSMTALKPGTLPDTLQAARQPQVPFLQSFDVKVRGSRANGSEQLTPIAARHGNNHAAAPPVFTSIEQLMAHANTGRQPDNNVSGLPPGPVISSIQQLLAVQPFSNAAVGLSMPSSDAIKSKPVGEIQPELDNDNRRQSGMEWVRQHMEEVMM